MYPYKKIAIEFLMKKLNTNDIKYMNMLTPNI